VELERFREALEAEGLRLAAVTYDSQETVARFAERFSLGYPLLADTESALIRGFGILNTDMPEGNDFHGIPYPGNYLLSTDGRVKAKYFLPDYQTRPSAGELLATTFGRSSGPAVELPLADVTARIALSDGQVLPGRQLGVIVDLCIAPGWHLYGEPLPENYVATRVTFDSDLVAEQSLEFPRPERVRFEALEETLPVYTEEFRASGQLLIRSRLKPGPYQLKGELRYQACSQESCRVPQTAGFEVSVEVIDQAPPLDATSG